MPVYEYVCDNCEHTFDLKQGYHDKPKKKCPACKKHKLRRVFSLAYASVKQEAKTVGHQAQRNTEEMGRYELEEKRAGYKKEKDAAKLASLKQMGVADKEATELPSKKTWYNPEGKDMVKEHKDLNTPEKAKKFILEGKK
jgi:putative FmdB family regulatory protein